MDIRNRDVYLNFISGQWKQGSSGQWIDNRNPAKPSWILGRSTSSNATDLEEAIGSAQSAFLDWSKKPRPQRGAVLAKAAQIMRGKIEPFAKILTAEEGKNLNEAKGEIQKAIHVLEFMAGESRRPIGQLIPSEVSKTQIYTTRSPLGVVGLITPWNFPICIPFWKIGPAILEGNTVIFKPSSLTPGISVTVVRVLEEAGLPAGVVNLIFGTGHSIGAAMTLDPRIKAISFTGSNEVGRQVYLNGARRLAKVQLEMGGKNPIVIFEDADIDQAVDATVQGAFGSTGQRCSATSRALVQGSIYIKFKEKLLAKVSEIKVGDGLSDPAAMGPLVDEKRFLSVLAAIDQAKQEGAKLLCGGEKVGVSGAESGYFVAPTIFEDVMPESQLGREEIFGPVLALMKFSSFTEAMQIANNVEYGLSSSIYTRDINKIMFFAENSEAGVLHVNSPTVGGEAQAPFGGMKATSIGGREMGSSGPEFFSEIKTVYIDYNSALRQGNLY